VIDPTNGAMITGTGEPGATVTVTAGGQTLTALSFLPQALIQATAKQLQGQANPAHL